MLRLNNNTLPKKYKMFIWLLMAFQAGYINVGSLQTFGHFVSHVTGTSSRIGMGAAGLDWQEVLTFITILFSFIIGAAFAGHFIGRKIVEKKEPMYVLVTGVKAGVFGLILMLSEHYFLDQSYELKLVLIFLLSVACGIQNATCSLATNGFLKPTHMTGLSTDIGINLFKTNGLDKNSKVYKEEKAKNRLRVGILTSFIVGGIFSYIIFSKNGYYGFLFPFLSSICMLGTSIVSENRKTCGNVKALKLAHSSIFGVFLTTLIIGVINIF